MHNTRNIPHNTSKEKCQVKTKAADGCNKVRVEARPATTVKYLEMFECSFPGINKWILQMGMIE